MVELLLTLKSLITTKEIGGSLSTVGFQSVVDFVILRLFLKILVLNIIRHGVVLETLIVTPLSSFGRREGA